MRRLKVYSLVVMAFCCCAVALAEVLRSSDLHEDVERIPGERQGEWAIEVGPATKLKAEIEVTAKGNGRLKVGNLDLHVVDDHDNGAFYQDGMAHVEFADVDGDGWKDLVVIRIVNDTGEKSEEVLNREPFTFIYRYDPKREAFLQIYKHASFLLEQGPQPQP